MKTASKILFLAAALLAASSALFAEGGSQKSTTTGGAAQAAPTGQLPRKETLYFNGILWDKVTQWNPYAVGGVSFGISPNTPIQREIVYETLFTYDILTSTLKPQIADSYAWDGQTLTIQLNKNVTFWDGSGLTAADVVNSYELQRKYSTNASTYWDYIDSVTPSGDYTVVIRGKPSNFNPKLIENSLAGLYITSKKAMDKVVAEIGTSQTALGQWTNIKADSTIATDSGTGPYKPYLSDETKAVLIRYDNYWGAKPAANRYGKLAAPRFIAHAIYKDNAAGDAAFREGQVDISQQFISSVWTMPKFNQAGGISTYLPQAPYYLPGAIPALVFNTKDARLQDPVVRRAIAMALDYNTIGQNAMSGYTAPYVASTMLPLPAEQSLIDLDALKPYQWSGVVSEAVAAANKALDDAGWVKGADGIRAKGGVKLSGIKAECPQGWSDWNASLEVVAQAGKQIGMDIQTYFPIQTVWTQDYLNGTFDILMYGVGGSLSPAAPWARVFGGMYSANLPPEGTPNSIGNFGRWVNKEADQIIDQLVTESNPAELKKLWTRLNIIYLQELPYTGLMYRPALFHTVNEIVWTGFPKMGDNTGVPPTLCIDGYGIKGLYNLKAR